MLVTAINFYIMQIPPYYIQLIYTTVRLYTPVNKTTPFSYIFRLHQMDLAEFINNDNVVPGPKFKIKRTYKKDSDCSTYVGHNKLLIILCTSQKCAL